MIFACDPFHSRMCISLIECKLVREMEKVGRMLHAGQALGMSYEISDARIADMKAQIWTLTHVTFTGAAILRREKAAYTKTWVELEK